ncbi:hypothetical protein Rhopal_003758-T1 [Rhodotorula paludigena]|uniref:RNA helicase n=1 Tax=Rhodotorula paludigena TaxID=86838 RepID=A0AAV5GJV2_9BASI|nr:hypothetical protein Rhopal_003758-T1 [Rhodotorula paludigena]
MAAAPYFSRAPGGHTAPSSAPSPALSGPSAFAFAPTDAISISPDDHRFARPPGLAASSSSTSAVSSFGYVDPARPYPPVEHRSFRDASHAGDVVVERQNSLSVASALGLGRRPSASSIGTIGEGRRVTPSSTPVSERREEEVLLGLPSGIFDAHGALAAHSSGTDDARTPSDTGGAKSRPSSFILDVLPQTRERSGPPTPSLSLDSVSQPPSANGLDLHPLPSPHSLAPSTYLNASGSTSNTSLPLSPVVGTPGYPNVSRTASPAPLDGSGPAPGSAAYDALASKVNTLEGTVSGLSSVLANEFRSLREEVGLLRSLVLQQQQQQQQASVGPSSIAMAHRGSVDRLEPDASPLLTLRSPSPGHGTTPTFPSALSRPPLHPASSSLMGQPASSLHASTPGLGGSFFGLAHQQQQQQQGSHSSEPERLRSASDESASLKDEQIKLLTAQVSSLSTTVSQLLSSPALNPSAAAAAAAHPQRGMSLPSLVGSPGPPSSASMQSAPTGLGVSGVSAIGSGAPGGGGARPSPMLRSASGSGVARAASLRASAAAAAAAGGTPSFDGAVASASAWEGGMSSPMLGASGGAMGGGGGAGGGANPPGSLGAKWEALGVGQDLFRAIAKYGLGPPTKIQGKAIPCVVRGQDAVAQAPAIQERIQCYVIPALQILYSHATLAAQQAALEGTALPAPGIQVIVVTATVDQAAQAQRLAVGLGGTLGIRTALCVGSSSDLQNELQTLLKAPPHVLVGTPQKLLDLFSLRQLSTSAVRLLVVDECDQLIARNLSDHVLNLARLLPPTTTVPVPAPGGGGGGPNSPSMTRSPLPGAFDSPFSAPMSRFGSQGGPTSSQGAGAAAPASTTIERQMVVFSCTVPQDVLTFGTSLQLKEPVKVLVRRDNSDGQSPSMRGLKQYYMYLAMGGNPASRSKAPGAGRREAGTAREWKLEALADLCEDHMFEHAVIFASSIDSVEAVTYKLGTRAIEALALHQDMGQAARQQIIAKFRSTAPNRPGLAPKRVLVVYDALSRGLSDVGQVPLVINFDMPRAVEDYVHRIACATGQNKNSMVINVVTPSETDMLRNIESFFRCKILELPHNFATST